MDTNYFAQLNAVDVSAHIERKGEFAYLSWPFAVQQLRLADPAATWEVRRFDGLPYLKTETGYFVEVAVTVQGVTSSRYYYVLTNTFPYIPRCWKQAPDSTFLPTMGGMDAGVRMDGGTNPPMCMPGQTSMCCGDGFCGPGVETVQNCPADCN